MNKWDLRFLELAKHVSSWSKDPSTKVGAVIVDDKRHVVGLGYNGFPRGVDDTDERLTDRPTKYAMVAHAELNAILNATTKASGSTIYVYPLPPCNECAKLIIQAGIKRVVAPKISHERWGNSNETAATMFSESEIKLELVDIG